MISAITVVRDRSNRRIQNCINAIKNFVDEIIVIDYGSKKPVKVNNAKIIRYDKNNVWNKSHGLNYGIKKSNGDYIMTIDCDIIVTKEVMERVLKSLGEKTFIINTNVKRINAKDIGKWNKSWGWYEDNNNLKRINSKANGGIQVFSRKWIYSVGGYDENLILWGAVDNDLYQRALFDNCRLIDINLPMYHQEHPKKEDNLPEEMRERARFIRIEKSHYNTEKILNGIIYSNKPWGEEKPSQEKFIRLWTHWNEEYQNLQDKRLKMLEEIKQFIISKNIPIQSFDVKWRNR